MNPRTKWIGWIINGILAIGLFAVGLGFARLDPSNVGPDIYPYGFGAGLLAFALGYFIVALVDKSNPDKWQRRRKRTTYGLIIATVLVLLATMAKITPGLE